MAVSVNVEKVVLPNNPYTNCHFFTRDFIVASLGQNLRVHRCISADTLKNLKKAEDSNVIADIYNSLVSKTEFQKKDCNQIPVGSVIIFMTEKYVLHTMIVAGVGVWVGANNGDSLGLNNCSMPHGDSGDNGVRFYNDMSERKYAKAKSGGWDDNDKMRSIFDQVYKMYYIGEICP